MISGTLLLNPSYQFNFKKSFLRLAFPLIIWSVLGALLVNYYYGSSFNFKQNIIELPFAKAFSNGQYNPHNGHFWYVYAMIGFYFVMPILKKITNNLEQKEHRWLLLIWLIFSVLSPSISYYMPLFNLSGYRLSLSMGHLGFLFLGYYIDKYISATIFANKKITLLMLGGLVVVLLVPWVLTWYHNLHATGLNELYLNNINIFVVLQAICFFMLAKYFLNRPSRAIALLSKLSFTAYCCHIIVRLFLNKLTFLKPILSDLNAIAPTVEMLFKFTFVAVISYFIAYLLSRLHKKISFYFGI